MLQVSVLISSSPPLTHFLQTELCPFCPSNRLSQGRSQDQAGSKKGARAQNFRGYRLSGSECLLTLCTLKRLTRPGSSLCESHRPILSHCTRGSLPRPSQSWLRLLFRPPLGRNLPGMAIFHLQSAVFLHSSYQLLTYLLSLPPYKYKIREKSNLHVQFITVSLVPTTAPGTW